MEIGGTDVLIETSGTAGVDIRWGAPGTVTRGLGDALATAVSGALHGGVPVIRLVEELLDQRFVPYGPTDDPQIPEAASVADYLARRMALDWLTPAERRKLGLADGLTWADAYTG